MKNKKTKVLNLILPPLTVGVILFGWTIGAIIVDSEYILPSLTKTLSELFVLLKSANFYLAFLSTFFRSFIAFFISFMLAFILAIASIKVKYAGKIINVIISVMRALPTIAAVLLLLFWTTSKIAPVVVTTLVVLPTLYTQFVSAFNALDKTVLDAGKVDGADFKRNFIYVELPQTLPSVFDSIGSGFSLNFKLMVAAEVIAQTANSIGYLLNTSKVYFEIAQMLAVVLFSVIVGVVIELIFTRLSKKAGEWR